MVQPKQKVEFLDIHAIAKRWECSARDVLQHAAFNGLVIGIFICEGQKECVDGSPVIPHSIFSRFCRLREMQARQIFANGHVEVSTVELILNGGGGQNFDLFFDWERLENGGWEMHTVPETDNRIVTQNDLMSKLTDVEAFEAAGEGAELYADNRLPVDAVPENRVYWRVILDKNIATIDSSQKKSAGAVQAIKFLKCLGDTRIPNKGKHDELHWINDFGDEQIVAKKTVQNALSVARNARKLPG